MESANKYDTGSSLSTGESKGEPESESWVYQPSPNGEMPNYSNNIFGNIDYIGPSNLDYWYSQQSLLVPSYGYYDFDGNFCGNYNHGMYLSNFKEVDGSEYYAPNFNLPMPSFSKCLENDMNLVSINGYGEDSSSWKPEVEELYYNGYSDLNPNFFHGLSNDGSPAHYYQTPDSYNLNLNYNCFGTGNMETTYFPQQEYTFPYIWYPSEVPGYFYEYETNCHYLGE